MVCTRKKLFCCVIPCLCLSVYAVYEVFLQWKASRYCLDTGDPSFNKSAMLFPTKPLVIWSNDYHISPIQDLKNLLRPLGVVFIDKSFSGHCFITNTCFCKFDLKVINQGNAMDLTDPGLIPRFYEAYMDDPRMKSVDAFVCFHPAAMCELFRQFNKSLLVIASTRYELGRFGEERWTNWNKNLVDIAASNMNVVGGNNLYDAEYIKYFTSIQTQVIPTYGGYISERYTQTRSGFILSPIHQGSFQKIFLDNFQQECRVKSCKTRLYPLRETYPNYEYTDLAAHRGIVYVPYQVSVMSLFEQYRMNIPLFFPSQELLADWQHEYQVMNERTWDGVGGKVPAHSAIKGHPSTTTIPDPNNEKDKAAIRYWIQFSDFYQWPHITYYNSFSHLVEILEGMSSSDLWMISKSMRTYNAREKKNILKKWKLILRNIARYSINKPH